MKCKIHPKYSGKRPPQQRCYDCYKMWQCSPNRKMNIKRCLCLKCGKRINKPSKQLYNYCYLTKDSCSFKSCMDCLISQNQVIECELIEEKIK